MLMMRGRARGRGAHHRGFASLWEHRQHQRLLGRGGGVWGSRTWKDAAKAWRSTCRQGNALNGACSCFFRFRHPTDSSTLSVQLCPWRNLQARGLTSAVPDEASPRSTTSPASRPAPALRPTNHARTTCAEARTTSYAICACSLIRLRSSLVIAMV